MTVPTAGQNTDTSAAADLMNVVGDVDDVEARREQTGARKLEGTARLTSKWIWLVAI